MATNVKAPNNLGPVGRKIWRETMKVYDLDVLELRVLEHLCRTEDLIEAMHVVIAAAVADGGLVVAGSMGQDTPHALLGEVRQHRASALKLRNELALPASDETEKARAAKRSSSGRELAQARWKRGA